MPNKNILALLTLFTLSAEAAMVTRLGTDVSFTYDDSTLFGEGYVVGNSIHFLPTGFRAESINSGGLSSVSDTLDILVSIRPESTGMVLTDAALLERGDYRLGQPAGTSTVSADGTFSVTSNTKLCGGVDCADSEMFSAGPLTARGTLTEWTAGADIDFGAIAGWLYDTSIDVQIQNTIAATSAQLGDSAGIQKKFGAIGLALDADSLSIVPIPAAALLFGSALGLLGWIRSRS